MLKKKCCKKEKKIFFENKIKFKDNFFVSKFVGKLIYGLKEIF